MTMTAKKRMIWFLAPNRFRDTSTVKRVFE